ncbi:hypothetical protein V6N12_020992 [Hibiscus sabdariffa]|uniref:Uncharacterized protein n=1 Tax=Hibiscus sabdariffa TaxID=183260 RepID=A0ABR2CZP6_9ROSI
MTGKGMEDDYRYFPLPTTTVQADGLVVIIHVHGPCSMLHDNNSAPPPFLSIPMQPRSSSLLTGNTSPPFA